jgi:hypothetical protein
MNDTNILDDQSLPADLSLSALAMDYIVSGSKWARFLAVLGFISTGILTLSALGVFAFAGVAASEVLPDFILASGLIFFVFALVIFTYFLVSLYLYRFSDKLISAISNRDELLLEDGFRNYKRLCKFVGILTIVSIVLYFFMIPILSFLLMDSFYMPDI